jgi:hypothetical protein
MLVSLKKALKQRLRKLSSKVVWHGESDSYDLQHFGRINAALQTARYLEKHALGAKMFADKFALLTFCAELSKSAFAPNGERHIESLVLEFGVHTGGTINHLAGVLPDATVYGFDVFTGLPEDWRAGFEKGHFAVDGLPPVKENVTLIKGLFSDTLPRFMEDHPNKRVALLHVDCDLYSSTVDIFQQLGPRLVPGSVICFDEYWNYPGWREHEFKAWREWTKQNAVSYKYVGLVPSHQQVAVRITEVRQ